MSKQDGLALILIIPVIFLCFSLFTYKLASRASKSPNHSCQYLTEQQSTVSNYITQPNQDNDE